MLSSGWPTVEARWTLRGWMRSRLLHLLRAFSRHPEVPNRTSPALTRPGVRHSLGRPSHGPVGGTRYDMRTRTSSLPTTKPEEAPQDQTRDDGHANRREHPNDRTSRPACGLAFDPQHSIGAYRDAIQIVRLEPVELTAIYLLRALRVKAPGAPFRAWISSLHIWLIRAGRQMCQRIWPPRSTLATESLPRR